MKDRIKRTLALFLALVLLSAAVFNDGLSIVQAEGETGTISFSIQGIDGATLTSSASVLLKSGEITVHDGVWDAAEEFSVGTYTYLITKDGYQSAEGTVAVTDSAAPAEVSVTLGKTVNCTLSAADYNGAALGGAAAEYNGSSYTADANGRIVVPLNAGEAYSITVKCDGYEDQTVTGTAAVNDFSHSAAVNMGYKSVNKTFYVTYTTPGNSVIYVKGASVTFTEQGGTESITASETDGTYGAVLKAGKTYTITGTCAGFTVTGSSYTVAEDTSCPNLTVQPAALTIQPDKTSITFNGTSTENAKVSVTGGKIEQSGFTYVWSSSDPSVLTVDDNGVVTALKNGSAMITLKCQTNGKLEEVQSASTTITVQPGSIQSFNVNVDNGEATNQSKVSFQIAGIPEAGTLTMKATGGNLPDGGATKTWNVNADTASVEWTPDALKDDSGCLKGTVSYQFTYTCTSGNYQNTTATFSKNYYISKQLDAEVQYKDSDGNWKKMENLVYGLDIPVKVNAVNGTTEDTSELTYTVPDDSKVLSIAEDGTITIRNAGTVEVTVTRKKDDNNYWAEASCTVNVIVKKKTINPMNSDITVFQQKKDADGKVERIYDPDNKSIEVTGEIAVNADDGLIQADEGKIIVKATVDLPSADAGTYTAGPDEINVSHWELVSADPGDTALVGNYTLPDLDDLKANRTNILQVGTFQIQPKEVLITVANQDGTDKGTLNYGLMNQSSKLTPENMVISVEGVYETDKAEFDKQTTKELSLIKISGVKDLGTHVEELTVDLVSANAQIPENSRKGGNKNYIFPEEGHTWADLEVVKETISDADLSKVVEYTGTNIYVSENYSVWVNQTTGKLYVGVKDGSERKYNERYNSVLFENNGKVINLTEDGIEAADLQEADTLKVCLALKADDGTYKNHSKEFELPFNLDETAPAVTYQASLVETVTVADDLIKSISFGTFDKAVYTANFEIKDDKSGFAAKDSAAYVWKLSEDDLKEGTVSADAVKAKVGNLTVSDWQSFSEDINTEDEGNYSVSVAVDETGQADVIAGNYIVLVRAEDMVGNVAVYASNGIVIDIVKPSIDVSFTGEKKTYYAGDIPYSIEVKEGSEMLGVSGVAEVEWIVTCNGTKVESNSGSEDLNKTESGAQYTVDELKKVYSSDQVIKAEDCNSNNIQLEVKAKDRAGNEVVSETYKLIIDKTRPQIEVAYDNLDVENGIYFKTGRVATITFTERNFDKSKVNFDLALEDGTTGNYSLEELNEINGISAGWGTDSQAGEGEENYTDERTNTAVISFTGDNHYSNFVPHCTDKAGNVSDDGGIDYPAGQNTEKAKQEFVVDTKPPVITAVNYTVDSSPIAVGKTKEGRIYKNKTIDTVITVNEHNFALTDENGKPDQFAKGQMNYSVKATEVGEKQSIPDYNAQANETGNWMSNGDIRTSKAFVYSNDANYTTNITYKDLAGHEAVWGDEYFTVDKTAPTGSVKVGTRNIVTQFLNSITFYFYSKTPISVNFTGADHTSPIRPLVYYKAYTPMNLNQVAAISDWTPGTSFQVNPDSQVVPYLKVTDFAGNVAYFSSNEIAVADDTAPLNKDMAKPLITITTSQPAHDIYNGDVSFAIHAEDPVAGNTYSGLATVTYEILNNNKVTKSHTYNYASNTNRTRVMDTNEVVKAAENNSNHVRIKVTATDNAGNVSEEIKDIKIDITKPTIDVTFNNNNALNHKYYKDTRVATVTVTERNFDPNNVQINVTNTHGTQASISGWSHSASAGESDSATHTATITFSADGDYTFTVDCTDLAMNKAQNPYKSDEFTIDKTIPTIHVSYDNNSAQNGNYYKASRIATITITEHNFSAGDVKVTATASNGSAPGVSGWSSSGDRHTAIVRFASDADYTFDIEYTDMAGNSAADYDQDKFTVDLTKPALEITGVKNKSANKGTVAPVIKVSDTNFTAGGVTLTLTGVNKGKINTANMVTRANAANGQTITFLNFGANMDDIYTLTAKSVDKAGNETTKSITFSVNRDGSAYRINDATRKLIDSGFTNKPQDIVIEEINVDTLEFIEISYSKDGKITKLKEGENYSVKVEGGEGQWKKYTYTIFASCFEEEGEYSINISSTDRAENISNNKVQSVNVDFVVDKTAPTMAVSNLENRGRYKESRHEYTLNVKDNAMLVSVEIYLDDKLYKTYKFVNGKLVNVDDENDVLEMDNGKVYLGVDSKNSYQKIRLVSTDAAGNVSETEDYNVLVTTSNWVQFYANKPLFFGCIAAIVIICGFIFFIIWKRKKDEEEKKARR